MSSIKTFSLLLALLVGFLGCQSSDTAVTVGKGAKQYEGWAGPPESPDSKPFDYFYMKYAARASAKAIEKKSGAMMQSTCTDAATTQAKGDLIGKMIGESIEGASGVSDGESTGKVVVREFEGKLQGVNTKECRPTAIAKAEIPGSEYMECECVIFVRIDGGRDTIIARAKEVDKKK